MMRDNKFDKTEIWVICASCGHQDRNHRVLHEAQKHFIDEPSGPEVSREYHRLAQCKGCETIKYVISTMDMVNYDELEGPEETNFIVYPDAPGMVVRRRPAIGKDDATGDDGESLIPDAVWKMYRETVEALSANIRTLAAGGLRAVVEAICLDKKIADGNLQTKIEELAKQGFLTKPQTELLHEERYLGNAALHKLDTPSAQDIEDGLGIVEGLISTIYILPSKAERLKKRREAKAKPAPAAMLVAK
ncbi:MAG TPA: DUF4145 domain-containing protein [Pirellulales bacterium]|nr:DUF4145 domain-containing protein [Pirellulales bacterium]